MVTGAIEGSVVEEIAGADVAFAQALVEVMNLRLVKVFKTLLLSGFLGTKRQCVGKLWAGDTFHRISCWFYYETG